MIFFDLLSRYSLQDLLVELPVFLRNLNRFGAISTVESLYHLLQDELSEGIDRCEEAAERLLLSIKTVDELLVFNLNLPDGVHFKLE